jgi:hypothetical protein
MSVYGSDIISAARKIADAIRYHADKQVLAAKVAANSEAYARGLALPYPELS